MDRHVRRLPDHQTRSSRRHAVRRRGIRGLHDYLLDRLVPGCEQLLRAAAARGEIKPHLGGFELMYAVGNLCAGSGTDPRYDARQLVGLLIAALRA